MRSTLPPIQCVQGGSFSDREADHSSSSSAEVKKERSYSSIPIPHGVHRNKIT
jgi:hypothetical protein